MKVYQYLILSLNSRTEKALVQLVHACTLRECVMIIKEQIIFMKGVSHIVLREFMEKQVTVMQKCG